MYNNQSATDNSNHPFFGMRGASRCGEPGGFGGKFAGKFGGKAPWMKNFGGMLGNRKAVNIEETETDFILHLYAAGLVKENFTVTVKDNVLSIAYKIPAIDADADKFTHREYTPGSFERLFQLSEKVLTQQVNATYNNGVLKVSLPKNPETNVPAQTFTVE